MTKPNIPIWEVPVVTDLVDALLMRGFSIEISEPYYDDEPLLDSTTNRHNILASLNQCDEDVLSVADEDGYMGYWWLIYNNGSEHDPMVVISDYVSNPVFNDIWNELNERYGV